MRKTFLAAVFLSLTLSLSAQQPPSSSVTTQREAMKKLAFLAGHWSGPATISRGPGEPLHLVQTEEVQYKLDGLVMLIEGTSRNAEGKVVFTALATISFHDASGKYRFRAFNDGHYLDTELTVPTNGFSWGFTSGPAVIANTMHRTDKGEWAETTEATIGNNPPRPSVTMLLKHQP